MSALSDKLRRATAPQMVVAISRWQWPRQLRAVARRALGRRPRIELYFAYDDPYSTIALPGLIEIARRHNSELRLYPLIERGIAGDPAAAQRARHAVADSRRLGLRDSRELRRREPLHAQDCAFLAVWTAAAHDHPGVNAFATAALTQLWFGSDGPPARDQYRALHQAHFGTAPPDARTEFAEALARNATRLRRLGHWESPAARIDRQWFFAHERLAQIDTCLQALAGA
ncbi:MAG: hypothetical protein ACRESS_07240 [Stenotrophobium sp.]